MNRALAIAFAALLLAQAAPAHADEEKDVEDKPTPPRLTLALRPAVVAPFGRLDFRHMDAAVGGGLDAEVSLHPSLRVEWGLVVGATHSSLLEDTAWDIGERTGSVRSYRVGSFVQFVSSNAPLAVYGRAGAAYRMVVQRLNYAPAERNTDFFDGAELDLGGGIAISTGSFRIEPGVDLAVCRMWSRGDETGYTSGPAFFASLGVRGAFDVR